MENTEREARIKKLKDYLDMLRKRHGRVPLDVREAIQERIRLNKKL